MRPLLTLHHVLEATGRAIGQVTRLVLVVILFAVPLIAWAATIPAAMWLAAVFVGVVAPTPIPWPENPGLPVVFVLVFLPLASVFSAFIGFYVTPHVEPQLGKARDALLNLDLNEPKKWGPDHPDHIDHPLPVKYHTRACDLCGLKRSMTPKEIADELPAGRLIVSVSKPVKYRTRACDLCGLERSMTSKEIVDEMIPLTSEELATRLRRVGEE